MKQRSLVIADQAQEDLVDIWLYIANDSPQAADNLLDFLHHKCESICASPEIGRERRELIPGYPEFLVQLKASIRQRQDQALRAVNRELVTLHMEIGQAIHQKQEEQGWGKVVVETLARACKSNSPVAMAFPHVTCGICVISSAVTVSCQNYNRWLQKSAGQKSSSSSVASKIRSNASSTCAPLPASAGPKPCCNTRSTTKSTPSTCSTKLIATPPCQKISNPRPRWRSKTTTPSICWNSPKDNQDYQTDLPSPKALPSALHNGVPMKTNSLTELAPTGYADWLQQIKASIAQAQQRASLAVNAELVQFYGRIGREILLRQDAQGWGAKVIDRLAHDLKDAFPDMRGWSSSNLKYMRYFAQHCPDGRIGQQAADQLPWFHIVTLLTKLENPVEREWYATQSIQQGWSRTTLELNIKNRLHQRQGAANTNSAARLPAPDSALAHETLKDPYLFDFLGLGDEAQEREIENGLVRHITRFLLELGTGFAFMGRQVRLEVAGDEFFIDLLFYHTRLKRYVVVELKATAFKPEHAGQLNFYLSAVDAQIKAEDDKPTIGLLLCKQQNRLVAEYALSGIEKPIGVAEYQLLRDLPEALGQSLPSIEAIEAELAADAQNLTAVDALQ